MTRHSFLAAGFLLALAPAMAIAQDSRPAPDSTDLVAERTFTLPQNEAVRLWLAGGESYRIELDGTTIPLRLRPVDEANEPPLIQPLLLGRSASGTALYTVLVRDAGYYTLRSTDGAAGRAVNVRVALDRNVPKEKPKDAVNAPAPEPSRR